MTYTLTFGKYTNQTMKQVWDIDAEYVRWLAGKSYNVEAKRAAQLVIGASLMRDDLTRHMIHSLLKEIFAHTELSQLKRYRHRTVEVRRDYANISFCTHVLDIGPGLSDDFWTEDWELVQIATSYEGLYEVDEEDYGKEYPEKRPQSIRKPLSASSIVWYVLPDHRGQNTLSAQPLTLVDAVLLLEKHLALRGDYGK